MERGILSLRFTAGLLSILVLVLLVLVGPVQAYVVDLGFFDSDVLLGDTFSFVASMEIEDGDNLVVESFLLDLSGDLSISCLFYPNGTKISSCNGIVVDRISEDFYGYGYDFWTYRYNITLDTDDYPVGVYASELTAITDQGVISRNGGDLRIYEDVLFFDACSLRSEDGEMVLLGKDFGNNNKWSFNVQRSVFAKGSGFVSAQLGRERFSYKFNVKEILSNSDSVASVLVDGEYKIQRGGKVFESAIIYLDKKNNIVEIVGDSFFLKYMNVTFLKGCQ